MTGSSGEMQGREAAETAGTSEVRQDGARAIHSHCVTVTQQVVEQAGPDGAVRQVTTTFDYYSCEEAIQRLNDYLDQELEPAEREDVIKHLTICRPCLERFDFERHLLASLRDKIKRISAPGALRSRLGNIIKQITVMLMSF